MIMAKKKFKLSEKQRQNRIERFVSKYGYDPRSSYRPHKTGVRGRPVKTQPYNKALVKAVNERFRKIEKVYGLSEDSNEYKLAMKYATEYSKTKGKIYNQKLITEGKVRLLNESDYNNLSAKDKKYFNEVLQNILKASTTTKQGIESKYEQSYRTFMENYGYKYPNLTQEEYKDFFKIYRNLVNSDKRNQFDYNTLVQTLEFIDIGEALRQDQLQTAMKYVSTNRFNKIPKRFRLRT